MTTINLTKKVEKAKIQLEKKGIFGELAQVVGVIDISASMSPLFDRGVVQELTERLLALGMNMDDNKSIDIFAFGETAKEVESATEGNIDGFVNRMMKKNHYQGGTRYAPALEAVLKKFVPKATVKRKGFFGKKEVVPAEVAKLPTFVLFVTDGTNSDREEAEEMIRNASGEAVFFQFVGIGNARFNFLEKLDDMGGRVLDNVDFFQVKDLTDITDEELYAKLLNEYPQWIKDARKAGILQ